MENERCLPSVAIPNGLFHCEKCERQHLGISLENTEFQYLKRIAEKHDLSSVVATMNEQPFPDYKDICDEHLEKEALNRHRCVGRIKRKRSRAHHIPIVNQQELEWLREFFEYIIESRKEWLEDNDPQDEEWTTYQLELAEKILDIVDKGVTRITLTDQQISELGVILHAERDVFMDEYDEAKNKEGLCNQLEMINYFLHLIHQSTI